MKHSSQIRKISFGENPLSDASVFVVGNPAWKGSEYKVSTITEDYNNFFNFGVIRYNIYITKDGVNEFKWKSFERVPVAMEYTIPKDNELTVVFTI